MSKLNPLILIFVVLIFMFLVVQAHNAMQFVLLSTVVAIGFSLKRESLSSIVLRVRPFLIFLPLMFGIYIATSLVLADHRVGGIVAVSAVSALRLILVITVMSLFVEVSCSTKVLDAARTQWYRTGLRWRFVEDLFQLLYLTFRFFPTAKEEIQSSGNFERALAIVAPRGKLEWVRGTALRLPGMIAGSLRRAENLGLAMQMRGYGQVLPRGIASPVRFTARDGVTLGISLIFATGFVSVA